MQKLTEDNKRERLVFCRTMLQNLERDPDYFSKILWTDESSFSTAGIPNRHNQHYWCSANPQQFFEVKRSGRRSLNVWCGIKRNRVLGPVFYEHMMTGEFYFHALGNEIEDIIDTLPLDESREIIFQQDGAPAHNIRMVTEYLNDRFETWIGRFGTIKWPPNSPDLTVLDTFLWGYLKNNIYLKNNEDINLMRQEIREEINRINRSHPEWIVKALDKLKKAYRLCIQENGGHFQHLKEFQ